MALLNNDVTGGVDIDKPKPVTAVTDRGATSPVYSDSDNREPLITDIEGTPFIVDYYNQVLANGETPKILDVGLDPTLQQYVHVASFIISATEELSSDTDTTTGLTTITGTGLLYPETVIPHTGDMFVGLIEPGVMGVFTITTVNRQGLYKRAVYEVEYRVYGQLDLATNDDLKSKVVEDRYFDAARLSLGKRPIVSYKTVNREERYKEEIRHLAELLYLNFYSHTTKTFIYNDSDQTVYDHWAVNYFNVVLGKEVRGNRPQPQEYNINDHVASPLNRPTIWRMLYLADGGGASYLYPRHYLNKSADAVGPGVIYNSITHSGIEAVALPEQWNGGAVDVGVPSYVLSHNFYDEVVVDYTPLEAVVWKTIKREPITDAELDGLLSNNTTLTGKEQFYYLILTLSILRFKVTGG